MRIVVLAHALHAAGGRVVGVNILTSLKNIDQTNMYLFIVSDQPEYRALNLDEGRHEVYYYRRCFSHLGRWFFDTFTLRQLINQFQPDVLFGMGNLGIVSPPCPQAILLQQAYLVYDVQSAGRLSFVDKLQLFFTRHYFNKQISVTGLIFCQTPTMEKRLRSVFGYRGKTTVTENVPSPFSALVPFDSKPLALLASYADKYKLFYLTQYYPHKGLEMLVNVMDRYREELFGAVAFITIEARQHKNAARLLKHIKSRGLEDRIVNIGPLAQKELGAYYTACDCLVMPTRLESFSGTYLESMHFGLPILTSDLDFAREVCGDAALYFDPWDAGSIKDAILRLKNDPNLRHDLVKKGQARLSQCFGRKWDDIACDIKNELESLVSEMATPIS